MITQLPLPKHYSPDKVGKIWPVEYEKRAQDAYLWAKKNNLKAAANDRVKVGLMIIDGQITFCVPGFELFVAGRSGNGAVEDNIRLTEFIYRNLSVITGIDATMDTHRSMQIFHAIWLVDDNGNHPGPYSEISLKDVSSGHWKVNPAVVPVLPGINYAWLQDQLLDYCRQLEKAGKYKLTIWPYHAMLGGISHALVPSLHEAMFFHTHTRSAEANYEIKGGNPVTENYSVLRPEVLVSLKQPIAQKNTAFIKKLMSYDILAVAGQAKSHCLAWTIDDLLNEIAQTDPKLAQKVYLLEDCTSPVVVPGIVDHTDNANAAFSRFVKSGMHVVRSTDPIDSWPGVKL